MEELKDREEVLRLKEQALDRKRAKLQAKESWFFRFADSLSSTIMSDLIEKIQQCESWLKQPTTKCNFY